MVLAQRLSSGIRQRGQAREIKISLVLAQRLSSGIRQRRQAIERKNFLYAPLFKTCAASPDSFYSYYSTIFFGGDRGKL